MLRLACLHRLPLLSVEVQQSLRSLLASEMTRRYSLLKPPKGPRPLFTFYFESQLMDLLQIQKVLSDNSLLQLLPDAIKNNPKARGLCPMLAPKYPITMGARWQNYKQVFDGSIMSYQQLHELVATPFGGPQAGCFCHGIPAAFRPEGHGGHVYIADPDFLTHMLPEYPDIRRLYEKGAKFRPSRTQFVSIRHKEKCMDSILRGMSNFVAALDRRYRMNDLPAFQPWRNAVMNRLEVNMSGVPEGTQLGDPSSPVYSHAARDAMEDGEAALLKAFICLPVLVDKCTQNLAFTCYKHGAEVMLGMLGDLHRGGKINPTFLPFSQSPGEVIHGSAATLDRFRVVARAISQYTPSWLKCTLSRCSLAIAF